MGRHKIQKYVNNCCSVEEFKSILTLLLSNDKEKCRDAEMERHWNEMKIDLDQPQKEDTLHKIHFSIW